MKIVRVISVHLAVFTVLFRIGCSYTQSQTASELTLVVIKEQFDSELAEERLLWFRQLE